ncbi:MAG: DNA internalization-related competence protein ComEC/Rec2 [Gammaproteobacteria bacterium]|nr:DNA internalization-related competence protein ComEC/Rec2 [Gammaproteobacteria bacterium]
MIALAFQVLLVAVAVQWLDTRWLLAWWPLALPTAALLGAGHSIGRRAGLLILVSAWCLARADGVISTRLTAEQSTTDHTVTGVICDFPRGDAEALRFVLQLDDSLSTFPSRLHLSWYDDAPELVPGERWRLRVRLKPPHGAANPAGFDFERWLYAGRIGATGYVREDSLNQRVGAALGRCAVGRLRARIAAAIETVLDGHRAAGHVLGIVVGATHAIDERDWELLRDTGTTHLLAISGLNIAMVVAPLLLLGRWLQRRMPEQRWLDPGLSWTALAVAALYSALSGFAVSTLRAFAMLACVLLFAVRRRLSAPMDVLALASIVVMLVDPPAVIGPGFWLSFVAVAWLITACMGTVESGLVAGPAAPARQWIGDLLRAQGVLCLGLAPLAVAWFDEISLVAPLTNLIAVPTFTLIVMPLALIGTALLPLAPGLAALLLEAAAGSVALLLDFLAATTAGGQGAWSPPVTSAIAVAFTAAAALLLASRGPVPGRAAGIACLLPLVAGTGGDRPPLAVTVLDVGQGLAVLVETARHALLYDTGPAFRMRDAGESVVVPVAARSGLRALDAVVVSHDDADHRGGLESVLRGIRVGRLIAPSALRGVAASPCRRGQEWAWDGVSFAFLSPDNTGFSSDNDSSCVLLVSLGDFAVLLPGDIERSRESWLAGRSGLGAATIVIAPHHGSRSSSSEPFVSATRPGFVVFSAGYRNRWGFPAAEVQERWRATGAELLSTHDCGAIRFEFPAAVSTPRVHYERLDAAHLWTRRGAPGGCGQPKQAETRLN